MTRPCVLWFTNQPAPYRLPSWRRLAEAVDLTVAFTGMQQRNRPQWVVPINEPYDVVLLTPRIGARDSDAPFLSSASPFRILRLLARRRPDAVVIQAWGDLPSLLASLSARALRMSRVGFYGTSRSTRRNGRLLATARRIHLRSLEAMITYGTEATALAVADGVSPHRIVTGFNTVDVERLEAAVDSIRSRGDVATEPHAFLFVGQLVDRKAPELALRAMATSELRSATLEFVGDGPLRSQLERQASALKVTGRVHFLGSRPPEELPEIYARAHTVVVPSRQEVWGLVANEALAAGLNVVVSRSAGCAADLESLPSVHLCDPDEDDVQRAMIASMRSFTGWTTDPTISANGAGRLAADAISAIEIANGHR